MQRNYLVSYYIVCLNRYNLSTRVSIFTDFQDSVVVFRSSFENIFSNERLVDNGKHLVLESLRELKLNKLHNLLHQPLPRPRQI
ncbi:hypothetical protein EUGRSUZ_L00767 [Eucalyptus grandis]|uniref:Uncharacterized protein n=1 Tax=Eucalyptus grandis TaxID=71139 RepID=A0A058ZUQ2_EUCGR|nr:hypothetical protein EUGRSUZ_L00767 [Eucalyptus grandis]